MKSLFQSLSNYIRANLWWFDVLYPGILAATILVGLTFFIYAGQRHRRISSQIEKDLITFSVKLAGLRPALRPDAVATISLEPNDLGQIPYSVQDSHSDAAISVYAHIIERLQQIGAAYVFVAWHPRELDGASDYDPLLRVLERPSRTKVFLGVLPNAVGRIPSEVRTRLPLLEGDPCQTGTQVLCIFDPQWSQWIMQAIPKIFWIHTLAEHDRPEVSEILPLRYPSYILRFGASPLNYSFLDALKADSHALMDLKGRAVFVGSALPRNFKESKESLEPDRIRTVFTPSNEAVDQVGMPLHEFWAQMTQMFVDDDLITIAHSAGVFAATGLLIILEILAFYLWGVHIALVLYLVLACALPLANGLSIRFLDFYLPIFDALYAGILFVLGTSFLKLSFESLRYWQLTEVQKAESEIIDTKSNFISLISHNLNTPVAKMHGMLTLLLQFTQDEDVKRDARTALRWLTYIQISIRSVLVAAAIEDGQVQCEPMNIKTIQREFSEQMGPLLKKLGLQVEVSTSTGDPDWDLLPLRFDKRVLMTVLSQLVILFYRQNDRNDVKLVLGIDELEPDHLSLISRVECLGCPLHDGLLKKLLHQRVLLDHEENLLQELAIKLLNAASRTYQGHFSVDPDAHSIHAVSLVLRSAGSEGPVV